MSFDARDRTGERVVTGQAQAMPVDPVSVIGSIFGWVRIMWIGAVILSGGIGTGVGLLIGEGRARAEFAARYNGHEERLVAAETAIKVNLATRIAMFEKVQIARDLELVEGRADREKIIEKIGLVEARMSGLQGSIDMIKDMLRQRGGR